MSIVRVVQFSDPHLFGDPSASLRGVNTLASLQGTLRHAQTRDWPPDAVLVTGDLVQDDPGGYALFRDLMAPLGKPVLCIPGNHDDGEAMQRVLSRRPFVVGGRFDIGAWRIVLLDSTIAGVASGRLGPEALTLLQESLAGARGRHVMVALHHHPVPLASRWLDRVGLQNADEFFRCIDAHRNVRAIIWGHVHQSHDALRNGVRLLATPSTCAQFTPRAVDFEVDTRPPAYRNLELHPDGTLVTDVSWVDAAASAARTATSAA